MVLVDMDGGSTLTELKQPFPHEVDFVISALEAGPRPSHDRQRMRRMPYRVRALLRLFSDEPQQPPSILFTRHIHSRAMGFVTQRNLPLSHGGVIRLPAPGGGRIVQIACTVLRCGEAAPGWFEGAVYFNREQPLFDTSEI